MREIISDDFTLVLRFFFFLVEDARANLGLGYKKLEKVNK